MRILRFILFLSRLFSFIPKDQETQNCIPRFFIPKKLKKRHFLLLEVMIALTIVIFAVLPLVYPHFYIYKEQKSFVNKLNLDLVMNHFKADIVQKLQRNEISFQDIEQGVKTNINFDAIQGITIKNFPYSGQYYFVVLKNKKNENFGLYQIQLNAEVSLKENKENKKPLQYEYLLFVARLFKSEVENQENENIDTDSAQPVSESKQKASS